MTMKSLSSGCGAGLRASIGRWLYEDGGEVIAYALFREQPEEIYFDSFLSLVTRAVRGLALGPLRLCALRSGPTKRRTVDVLVANKRGVAFWREVGYTTLFVA